MVFTTSKLLIFRDMQKTKGFFYAIISHSFLNPKLEDDILKEYHQGRRTDEHGKMVQQSGRV